MQAQITAALISAAAAIIVKQTPDRSRPEDKRGFDILSAVLTMIAVVLVLTLAPVRHVVIDLLAGQDKPNPSSASAAEQSIGQKPSAATACQQVHELTDGPAHSAVDDPITTTCLFAEEVRLAYAGAGQQGGAVKLPRVHSPATGKNYSMTCSGDPTVTCTGGKNARVYLY